MRCWQFYPPFLEQAPDYVDIVLGGWIKSQEKDGGPGIRFKMETSAGDV